MALRLRNPWRYSFDRLTGDLYIADVEQGWSKRWITRLARAEPRELRLGRLRGLDRFEDKGAGPGELVFPIYEYSHDRGCTVVGGYVYRGSARKAERGRYVFGDYCSGSIWSLRTTGGKATGVRAGLVRESPSLTSFGEDAAGELYRDVTRGRPLPDLIDARGQAGQTPRV